MNDVSVDELATCQSTQDEVLARLADADAGSVVAVRSASQLAGRGRDGRGWQDPPGEALLLSVGVRGPLAVTVLDALPARLGQALLAALAPDGQLRWKEPNDLVASDGGAKVAGILVDARTVGTHVEHVVVGFGCNLRGAAFTTTDGRAATSLEAIGAEPGAAGHVAERVATAIWHELRSPTSEASLPRSQRA